MKKKENSKKVGVLSLPYDANYGWILQHYALLKILKNNNYETFSVSRKWDTIGKRSILYYFKRWVYYNILSKNIYNFYKKHITPRTEIFDTQESVKNISKYDFDAIIVGSDQVWRIEHTSGVGNNFFLDFLDSKKTNKISYAASFGIDEWQEGKDKTAVVKSLLEDFDYISVRETSGIGLCKREFDVAVECRVDPTLLLNKNQYNELLKQKGNIFKRPTLVTYILDSDKSKDDLVNKLSKLLSLQIYNLYPKRKSLWNFYIRVEKWLSAFRDCDFVITDSFHGTVFAIIYNKQFITIANKERGLARFTSLLKLFNLSSRLVFTSDGNIDIDTLISEKIDFNPINLMVIDEQIKSIEIFKKYI